MGLGDLLKNVVDAITGSDKSDDDLPQNRRVYSSDQDPHGDPADEERSFGRVMDSRDGFGTDVDDRASFRDSYGNVHAGQLDPGGDYEGVDTYQGQEVLSSDQDPYGDPADEEPGGSRFAGEILSSDQDPYGDPADEERRR
jgi:hypothetical protein